MADYYSILKKTISGLADHSRGPRTAVYGKARTAIDRQLRAIEPTPSDAVIGRQMELLEAAIEKLDDEYNAFEAEQAAVLEPQIAAPIVAELPPTEVVTEEIAPAPDEPVNPAVEIPQVGADTHAPDVSHAPDASHANVGGLDYVPAGSASTPSVDVPQPSVGVDPQGMEYSETIFAAEPETQMNHGNADSGKKRGFMGSAIAILLALAVIGGGAYALWLNKDALLSGIMGEDQPTTAQPVKDDADPATDIKPQSAKPDDDAEKVRVVGDDSQSKNSAKLTADGETIDIIPEVDPVKLPSVDDADTALTGDDQDVAAVVPEDGGEDSAITPAPVDETTPKVTETGEATDTPQPASPPAVAQKAFLYEEGASGSNASRDNAAIIWSLDHEKIEGGEAEAIIRGQLDVPGRSLTMNLVIKRNRDDSLPASHIIELEFQLPKDFSGGSISSVSRFVMKTSEQGRGEGLVAVSAKISDGNFLIALNNLEQALETNRKLLLESSWVDVPLGYTTGRRALVTLEKGAIGLKVFKDAFADWDKR